MKVFLNIPFLRIMIPFIAGILVAIHLDALFFSKAFFLFLLLLIAAFKFFKKSSRIQKTLMLLVADIFLFLFGIALVNQNDTKRQENFYGNFVKSENSSKLIVCIDELPIEKEKSVKCNVQVLKIKVNHNYQHCKGQLVVYLKKSPTVLKLKAGQVLLLNAKLKDVPGPQNPFEFDYRQYLQFRQIFHTAYLDTSAFAVLNAADQLNPIWLLGLQAKQYILQQLKNSGLDKNSYAICSALLTGYDDEIDKSVMAAFSHSGTLHVLSVSGLHTGLIYLVLAFIFDLFDRKKKRRLLKFLMITCILWCFSLITGFSSPVLRAVLMFNLLGFGKIYFRQDYRNQMNILLVSAFILLVFNPFFITDVGFQLSYFALAGLIYFQPGIASCWQPGHYFLNSIWQSIAASVAATISTLPLTLLYFKQFAVWFFLCNLVVVPATFVILLLALLVVIHVPFVALLVNFLIDFLIQFINFFNSDVYGFVDMIDFTAWDALILSALIILVSITVQYRTYTGAVLTMHILIFWQVLSIVLSYSAKKSELFTCYALQKMNLFSVKCGLQTLISENDSLNFSFHVKPQMISFNHPAIKIRHFNFVVHKHNSILILNKANYWPKADFREIKTLVLCSNFKLREKDLRHLKRLKTIVCASSNNNFTIKKTQELSRKFAIDFYDVKQKGAYLFEFD